MGQLSPRPGWDWIELPFGLYGVVGGGFAVLYVLSCFAYLTM